MRVAVVFSGGKDSTIAAFLMQQAGFEPILVTFAPREKHSYMLHAENLNITKAIAKAMHLPHHIFEVSGEKEKEIDEMLEHLRSLDIKGIASGAIDSEYQRQRIEYIGDKLSIPTYAPLWRRPHIVKDFVEKMDVRIVKVAADGLSQDILGEHLSKIWGLKNYLGHPLLEGGEGESIVLDAPFFYSKLKPTKSEKIWKGDWGEWIIHEVVLVDK